MSSSIAAGSLTIGGTGLLVLSGTSLFTGSVTVNSGTLRLSGAGARLGVPAAGTGTVIRQGGVLDVNAAGSSQLLYTGGPTQPLIVLGPLTGSGILDNSSATAAAVSIGTTASTAAGVFTGIISNSGGGSLSVVRNGASGIVYLTGSNTYTGPTILSGGAVLGVTNLANGGVASGIGASSSGSASLVFNGGTLLYTGGNASFTQLTQTPSVSTDRLFTLAGNGFIESSGNYGNAASFAATQNNAALVFSNTGSLGYAGTGARTLTLAGNSTGDNEIKLALGNNGASALSVTKSGTGLWLLSGSNTYTGVTTISAGVLQAQDGVGLPTNSNLWITGGGVFQSSGTFTRTIGAGAGQIQMPNIGGFAASSAKLTVNLLGAATLGTAPMATSTLVLNSTTALADVEFASPLSLGTAARTIQVDDNANTAFDFATLSGTLSGTAASSVIALAKTGAGNLILSGANTYTGSTQVSQGALIVRSIGTLNATSSNLGTNSTNAGSLLLGNGATAATLLYVGPGEVTTRTVALASTSGAVTIDASGSGPLQLSTVSNSGAGAKTLTLRGFNTDMNIISSYLVLFK